MRPSENFSSVQTWKMESLNVDVLDRTYISEYMRCMRAGAIYVSGVSRRPAGPYPTLN
jgi:hypothetical protein